ncbi:hypothetical protein HanRHA438_Chr09g0407501 [Helianthus annuus]|nr:hypothetical protein HanRHA438_Chr09g0407501 [Helianthus annuus]
MIHINSCLELLSAVNKLNKPKDWKKTIGVVCLTTSWQIWKSRNEEFSNKMILKYIMVKEIKEKSFL